MARQIYHRLTIIASARHTEIWLGDDGGHLAPTYPINLSKPIRTSQRHLEADPSCPRPIPQIPPE